MKITLEDLEAKDACRPGREAFQRAFPEGWEGEWGQEAMRRALSLNPLRRYLSWAVEEGVIPPLDLTGMDFSDSVLAEAPLLSPKLQGTNFSGADLSNCWAGTEAHLAPVLVSCVSFSAARLVHASFENCKFLDCSFNGTDLRFARFYECSFYGCDFSGAEPLRASMFLSCKGHPFDEAGEEDWV